MSYNAAGHFRFARSPGVLYMDRDDVGSVIFERDGYGAPETRIDTLKPSKERLLKQIDSSVSATGLDPAGRRFVGFQDEYVAAGEPRRLSAGFDPRTAGRLVARTAEFERWSDGVPIFGSELVIGLMPAGNIGRFRMHWPPIDRQLIQAALKLRQAVESRSWQLPASMQEKWIEILQVNAGVGHSGIADPGFRAKPVVRVLYRKTDDSGGLRVSSTSYKYFDSAGRELLLDLYPPLAPTERGKKPSDQKAP